MNRKHVKIIQVSKHKWQIATEKGIILNDDIVITSAVRAEEYVIAYISSFNDWTYEVVPILRSSNE